MSKKYKVDKVSITENAQREFDQMHQNLEERYSTRVADKFAQDFDNKIEDLKKNPAIYQYSDVKKDARRALFGKYGAFLYQVIKSTTLLITTIFDTRQNK